MLDTREKSGTDTPGLKEEFTHRFVELMNHFDGIEFALRKMNDGVEKEQFRGCAIRLIGLMKTHLTEL